MPPLARTISDLEITRSDLSLVSHLGSSFGPQFFIFVTGQRPLFLLARYLVIYKYDLLQ